MKRTLLNVVQAVMNDMDSDPVNTIDETLESEQVAIIARDAFFDIIDRRNWPHLNQLIFLDPPLTSERPTHLSIPETAKELNFIQYNMIKDGETRKKYRIVNYLYPDEFLLRTNPRNNDETNIDVIIDPSGIELLIRNDVNPQWWTSFNDREVVFDAYDSNVDSTIQASKIQAQAYITPSWVHADDHVPFLPEEAHTLWLEETKSTAFLTLKQMVNEKAEGRAQKHDSWLSRKAFVAKGGVRYANFGRRAGYNNRHKTHPFDKDNT